MSLPSKPFATPTPSAPRHSPPSISKWRRRKTRTVGSSVRSDFPTFPVLPGVLMLEVLVQAARALMGEEGRRHVLGKVSATRYGTFVQPGESMWAEVEMIKSDPETGFFQFKGTGRVHSPGKDLGDADTCVSSRFTMRPMRIGVGGVTSKCSDSTVTSE